MSRPDEPTALERLAEITAAAGGGLVGFALGGPAGAFIGSASPPAVRLAWDLGNRALFTRLDRGSRTLDDAVKRLGTNLDGLAQAATADPARLELLARILEAGGRTPLAEKIPALGQILAEGIDGTTTMDEALILAAALDDLEAPHIRLLQHLLTHGQTDDDGDENGLSVQELMEALPSHHTVVYSLGETLVRHGLAVSLSAYGGGGTIADGVGRWVATPLGQRCLDLLNPT